MLSPGSFLYPKTTDTLDDPQEQFDREAEHDRMAKEYDDRITALAHDIVELRAIVDADISTITPTQITQSQPQPSAPYTLGQVKREHVATIYQRIATAQSMGVLSEDVLSRIQVDMRLLELWLDNSSSAVLADALCPPSAAPAASPDQAIADFRSKQASARKILDGYNLRRHEPEMGIAFGRADAMMVLGGKSYP